MATNLLQSMFVVVPAGKEAKFKQLHVGASAEDAYYSKIVFLEGTGEIVTKGAVYALNANLLNAGADVTGSIKNQIKTAIENIVNANENGAIDTLEEVISWINDHKGTDGSASGYLLADVSKLQAEVEGTKPTISAEQYAALSETEKAKYTEKTVGETTVYEKTTAEGGLLDRVASLESTNSAIEYVSVTAGSVATDDDGNGTYTAATVDDKDGKGLVRADAAIAIAEDAVNKLKYALDADNTSTEGKSITVEVIQTDGVVTDVVVTESFAELSYTASVEAGEGTDAQAPNITVADADADKALKASEISKIKNYVDDVAALAEKARQAAINALTQASATVNNEQNGVNYTSVTYKQENGVVTIESVANAIGEVAEEGDVMVVKTHGLIDANALATTLNNIDPWFEYVEEGETTEAPTTEAPNTEEGGANA